MRVAAAMEVSMAPPSPAAVRSSRVLPPWKIQHVQRSTVMQGLQQRPGVGRGEEWGWRQPVSACKGLRRV
jgi:hypothetical protein